MLLVTIGRTLLILVHVGCNFFTRVQKRFLVHYGLWSQILKSVPVSNNSFYSAQILYIDILKLTVSRIAMILGFLGFIVHLQVYVYI